MLTMKLRVILYVCDNMPNFRSAVLHMLSTVAVICGQPQGGHSHAGHDDVPEASFAQLGELDPRFYTRSDAIDATLILNEATTAHLYLVDRTTNVPVYATVTGEQLTPENRPLFIEATDTTGIYNVSQIGSVSTTATFSIEVVTSDTFDMLSFSNILRPDDALVSSSSNPDKPGGISTLPRYIVQALIAINGLVAVLLIAALLKYLFQKRHVSSDKLSSLVFGILVAQLAFSPMQTFAHAGDSHAGEGLASTGGSNHTATRHFVSVDTQIAGDIRTSTAHIVNMRSFHPTLGRISIRPDYEAAIAAPADGLLLTNAEAGKVPIAGEYVKKDDVLVRLQMIIPAEDKVTISAEKVAADAALNQARQEIQLARQELERSVQLGSYVAKSEVDRLQTEFQIARQKEAGLIERIATLNAALSGETSGVKTLEIKAPISGIISESHSTQGEYVNAGKALFQIVNIDELFVEADLFESDLRAIENATQARIYVEAYPNKVFLGKLHSVSPEIDPLRRTAKALFNVSNIDNQLKAGMFVRVEIETGDPKPVLMVPKSAIVSRDNLKQVYRKAGPEIYDAVVVQVENFLSEYAVLSPGPIKPDDVIVIQGQYQVRMSPAVGLAQ